MRFTLGADPELFIVNNRNQSLACAHGVIPGTKEDPYPVTDGAIQVDGIALEFNIHPAESEDEFVYNIDSVLRELRQAVPSGFQFSRSEGVCPKQSTWDSFPMEAKNIGCDPEYDAYTGTIRPLDRSNIKNIRARGAGGHIHIGWRSDNIDPLDPIHIKDCQMVAKELDIVLGVPSVLVTSHKKAQHRRATNNGLAGAFRPKPYGMEYRTLSNFWIFNDKYRREIYRTVEATLAHVDNAGRTLYQDRIDSYYVIEALESHSESYARSVLNYLPKDAYHAAF